MLKGVDMVLRESVSALGLVAILDSISDRGLPSHGVLEALEDLYSQRKQSAVSAQDSSLQSRLKAVNVQDLGRYTNRCKPSPSSHYGCRHFTEYSKSIPLVKLETSLIPLSDQNRMFLYLPIFGAATTHPAFCFQCPS